jgi:hydrogenase nickel incorporation protein HypA/HybF
MHEFSIALSILDIAESSAREHGNPKIAEVEIELGDMAGVDIDALLFAWESASGTSELLHNSKLKIISIPVSVRCSQCHREFTPSDFIAACPFCGTFGSDMIRGRELKVKSIILEDD